MHVISYLCLFKYAWCEFMCIFVCECVFNEFVSMCVIACILVRMNFMFLFLCGCKCMCMCINPLRVHNFCSVSLFVLVYVCSCMQAYLCVRVTSCALFLWMIFNEFMCLLVYMWVVGNMWMHSCFCLSVCLRLCEFKNACAQVHYCHCVRS